MDSGANFTLTSDFFKSIDCNQVFFDNSENSLFIQDAVDDISIHIYFNGEENELHEDRSIHPQLKDDGLLGRLSVKEVVVEQHVYTGQDEYYLYEDEVDDEDDKHPHEKVESITSKLYSALMIYFQHFKSIPFFEITVPVDYGMCPPSETIFYKVYFRPEDFRDINSFLNDVATKNNGTFISPSIIKTDGVLERSHRVPRQLGLVPILITSTKSRRLGYLKLIIEQFERSAYFPSSYLAKLIEKSSDGYSVELSNYKSSYGGNDKGVINLSNSGISALPYLKLCEQANIVTQISSGVILTKQAKIYFNFNKLAKLDLNLLQKLEFNSDMFHRRYSGTNFFKLNQLDKLFFLRVILVQDALYTTALLDIINIMAQEFSFSDIRPYFQKFIIDELTRSEIHVERSQRQEIEDLKKRIRAWENPIKYLEHVLEPRLNWFLDLGILETVQHGKTAKYKLSVVGKLMTNIMAGISEQLVSKFIQMPQFLNCNYFRVFSNIYGVHASIVREPNEIDIDSCLTEAFQMFKTEAPRRIAASQGIDYVCFSSLIYNNRILEFDQVKQFLMENKSPKFSLDWYKTENDGTLNIR